VTSWPAFFSTAVIKRRVEASSSKTTIFAMFSRLFTLLTHGAAFELCDK
jgi:hypothetical protein